MTRHADVVAALRLHAWAGAVLAGGDPVAPPPAGEAAWRLFLRVDACALPLAQRLQGGAVTLRSPEAEILGERSRFELQRTMAAHRELRVLADVSRAETLPIAVLKGGAAVARGAALDLYDVDVLVPSGRAEALSEALAARGYEAMYEDVAGEPHLAGRIAPGGIRIEIHEWMLGTDDAAALLSRAVPLGAYAPLRRLAPADQLCQVAYHAAVHHPERRGRLRDRLLLGHALAACAEDDLATARARIASSPRAFALRTAIASAVGPDATARHAQRAVSESDGPRRATDPAVAARMVLLASFPDHRRLAGWRTVVETALILASTDRGWREELRSMVGVAPMRRSALRPVAWVESRAPRIGRAGRLALALTRAVASVSLARYASAVGKRALRTA